MALDESTKQKLIDLAVEALRKDGTVESEAQLDTGGFCYVTARAFSPEVNVTMKISISPCVVVQLGLGLDAKQIEKEGTYDMPRQDGNH